MLSMRRIATAVVATVALAGSASTAHAQAPDAAHEWSVKNAFDGIRQGTEYKLFNSGSPIGYENRTFGVDLGWTAGKGNNFVFFGDPGAPNVRDHRSRPLSETENVAIYNTRKRAYLRFHERGPAKAELEWDRRPRYQWQIRRQQGAPNTRFALYNAKVGKFLVEQVKVYGINLGWLEQSPPIAQTFSLALDAQPVTQGWIPYLGTFGRNTRGKLLAAQNASSTATLLLVKPGRSTTQCGDPSATIAVPPRGLIKGEALQSLYGTATPALPVTFLACVTSPGTAPISQAFVNLTYRLDG